jgi:hypothetical protein
MPDGSRAAQVRIAGQVNGFLSGPTETHSYRSAWMGSARLARIAGIHTATSATPISTAGTTENTVGSHAFTPNSRLAISLVSPNAAASPITIPTIAKRSPWKTTMFRTLPDPAPSASRMPSLASAAPLNLP